MRDLCHIQPKAKDGQFQVLSMANLPAGEPGTLYASRWTNLKADSRVWADRLATQEFTWGALHLVLAKKLYCSPSMVLMDRVVKSFVSVSSGVPLPFVFFLLRMNSNANLRTGPTLCHGAD